MIVSSSISDDLIKDDEYRPGIGIMLISKDNLVFLGKRVDQESMTEQNETHSLQMPQGGIEPNESIVDAMYRELYEEVGIKKEDTELLSIANELVSYKVPQDILDISTWGHKYIGQKHLWFLLRLLVNDDAINFMSTNDPEFSDYKWVKPEKILNYAISFKRSTYEKILSMFQQHI